MPKHLVTGLTNSDIKYSGHIGSDQNMCEGFGGDQGLKVKRVISMPLQVVDTIMPVYRIAMDVIASDKI